MKNESVPAIRKNVIVFKKNIKNELLLRTKYSLERKNFKLNSSAKNYYELCDGEKTCKEIIIEMSEKFQSVPKGIIERDFENTLKEFQRKGIIEWKNGINAFEDEMTEIIDGSICYCACDYNEVSNLAYYQDKFDVYYLSPYYGSKFLDDKSTIETYMLYGNMFIFQYKVNGEVFAELLCESNYIDYSVQVVYMSYDSEKVNDTQLIDFLKWVLSSIAKKINPSMIDGKCFLFFYANNKVDKLGFLNDFKYHGVLQNEVKGIDAIRCYTFLN